MSDYATEGVLSMECENGRWRPVAFLSNSLNKTKRNYKIHNKRIGKLETFIGRCTFQVRDPDGS